MLKGLAGLTKLAKRISDRREDSRRNFVVKVDRNRGRPKKRWMVCVK